jgi:DNA helicase-2/ATP-dependent DNA helicase PcrA
VQQVIQPRPAYLDEDTDGAGPWGGQWNRGGGLGSGARGGSIGGARTAYDGARSGRSRAPASPTPDPFASIPKASKGVTVHYDEDQVQGAGGEELGLRVGGRLRHAQFGVGEVRGWQGVGRDLKVTLKFPAAGMKTVLARFLKRP